MRCTLCPKDDGHEGSTIPNAESRGRPTARPPPWRTRGPARRHRCRHRRSRPITARAPQRRPLDRAPGRPARRRAGRCDRAVRHRSRPRSARSSAAASARSASRRSTSPAPRGSRPGCRSRSRRRPSTRSAGRRSRRRTSPRRSIKAGVVDVALGCGVESMSRVPLGAAVRGDFGRPTPKSYFARYELTSQFEGAERIADKWGITRDDCDRFGLESQTRAQRGVGRGSLRARGAAGRRARRRRGRQADRHDASRSPATKGCARRRSRRWPSSSRSGARTACTPPVRRRRSPTVPRPCC